MPKPVYAFDEVLPPEERLRLLGGKASGLHAMTALGVPVPPGFTVTAEVGAQYRRNKIWPAGIEAHVNEALRNLEQKLGRRFGDSRQPLLVSVRSGAAASMPGMMDTLLNIGLSEKTIGALAQQHGGERFALDSYRRLLQMYGTIVRGVDAERFAGMLSDAKTALGKPRMLDSDLPVTALQDLVTAHLDLIANASGTPFPQDVAVQLWDAMGAVFLSWDNPRALRYRRMQAMTDLLGTACTVQAMVFGNTGPRSGSGVAFTRNPSNGERALYGEFLPNAQGEDVVAGIRTPVALTAATSTPGREAESLERAMPKSFAAISAHCATLEAHFGDMQDIEFTIEDGSPYLLQTRTAKRTAAAAVRIAVDLVKEGVLSREQALLRVDASSLEQLLQARLPSPDELQGKGITPFATGLPAGPGAACGRVVFEADEAIRWAAEGQDVILVRPETSAEDIHGMKAAEGVVTAAGGMTSHAAVVARGLGKCCVVGCGTLDIDVRKGVARVNQAGASTHLIHKGDWITIDGSRGQIYLGELDVAASPTVVELDQLMRWADDVRRVRVYADADTPHAARAALSYGAEGVGLCRTEHMFFAPERLLGMRCALLEADEDERAKWLATLEQAQQQDFAEMFRAMEGRPVTIRLLDRPLEEFMPREDSEHAALAEALDIDTTESKRRAERQRECNPSFGHRGVRAGLTMPALYEMQLRAMLRAGHECAAAGVSVDLKILVPMVAYAEEVRAVGEMLSRIRGGMSGGESSLLSCKLGAMIEVVRACLVSGEIAEHAELISFGGGDLTQSAFGMSREDANRFLPTYLHVLHLVKADPFTHLDDASVGNLLRMALDGARRTRPHVTTGLCGDHGGDPASIALGEHLGLDFVSCPLPRLPVARLAAAQARLRIPQ